MVKQICFISPKFSSHIGGMETHAYEFARAFAGHQEFPISKIFVKDLVTDGVPAPCDSLLGPEQAPTNNDLEVLVNRSLSGNFEKDAEIILTDQDPNNTIFYLNSPTWLPSLALIKQIYPQTRVIVRSGGNDIMAGWIGDETDTTRSLEASRARVVDLVNKYVDYFIVNSQYSYHRTISVGVNSDKLVKVIGGVDCNTFHPATTSLKETVSILTAARLVAFKGWEYSLQAVEQATRQGAHFQYYILGDGPERGTIERIVAERRLNNVHLLGARRIEDMPTHFRTADIFLHMPIHLEKHERGSSYIHTETMGRCLCEASASGLPIVASRVGGVPEILQDGETGFLVPERDYVTAANRLVELIHNPATRLAMGTKGRTRAETFFDWKIIFQIYQGLFK
ncbi:MAG: glycosyltransferase family 4 protein [Candidatus Nanoarchaeia archaeon]